MSGKEGNSSETSWVARDEKGGVLGGTRKYENMAAMISAGRDEMGASALRRCFNALMDKGRDEIGVSALRCFNDLISASMACRWCSRELRGSESIVVDIMISRPGARETCNVTRYVSGLIFFAATAPQWRQRAVHSVKMRQRNWVRVLVTRTFLQSIRNGSLPYQG
jgi:hypothetical protein